MIPNATAIPVQPAVAQLSRNVFNWLTRNGFPVRPSVTRYGMQGGAEAAGGSAAPGYVYLDPSSAGALAQAAALRRSGRGLDQGQLDAVGTLMHEQLHQMRFGRTPGVYGDGTLAPGTPAWYEEGAVQSAARDLLPIFANKMFGGRATARGATPYTGGNLGDEAAIYSPEVANIRQLSVFGSGATKFTKRPARVWRRQFLHADLPTREQMVQQATVARVAWGKAHGR